MRNLYLLALCTLLSGCADYLAHRDSVTFGLGSAPLANIGIQTVDPFNPASKDTRIMGDGRRLARAMRSYNGAGASDAKGGGGGYQQPHDADGSNTRNDIDCKDVNGPVIIYGDDPNNLDADNDSIGCENN